MADLLGFGLQAGAAKAFQEDAQEFQKKLFKNRYQWTMQDMERAGLNPMVVAKGGMAGSATGPGIASPGPLNEGSWNLRRQQAKQASAQEGVAHAARGELATRSEYNVANAQAARDNAAKSRAEARLNNARATIEEMRAGTYGKDPGLIEDKLTQEGVPSTITGGIMHLIRMAERGNWNVGKKNPAFAPLFRLFDTIEERGRSLWESQAGEAPARFQPKRQSSAREGQSMRSRGRRNKRSLRDGERRD